MRIGNRLVGRVAGVIVAALAATSAPRAVADEQVQPVPLGGSLTGQKGDKYFGVYVPTRFGGVLTVKSTSGKVAGDQGPRRPERKNGEEVGNDKHGWYTFKVAGPEKDKPYTVETTFVQVGQSTRQPWNFYYWPTKSDAIHEPWAGGNARVDTMQAYRRRRAGRHPRRLHRPGPGHRPRRPQRHPRDPRRRRRRLDLVPQPL